MNKGKWEAIKGGDEREAVGGNEREEVGIRKEVVGGKQREVESSERGGRK